MSKSLNDTVNGTEICIIYDADTEVITPTNARLANARTVSNRASQNREGFLCSVPLGKAKLFMFSAEAGVSLYAQVIDALNTQQGGVKHAGLDKFALVYCTDNLVYMAEIEGGLVIGERVAPVSEAEAVLLDMQSRLTVFLHEGGGAARTRLENQNYSPINGIVDIKSTLRFQWGPIVMLRHGFVHPLHGVAVATLGFAVWGLGHYQEQGSELLVEAARRAEEMAALNSTLVVDGSGGKYLERVAGLLHTLRLSGIENDLTYKAIAEGNLMTLTGSWTQGYPAYVSKFNKGDGEKKRGVMAVNETGWLLQLNVDAAPIPISVAGVSSEVLIPQLFSAANDLFTRFTITETTIRGLTSTVKFTFSMDNIGEETLVMLAARFDALPVRVARATCEFQLSLHSMNCQIEGEGHYETEA